MGNGGASAVPSVIDPRRPKPARLYGAGFTRSSEDLRAPSVASHLPHGHPGGLLSTWLQSLMQSITPQRPVELPTTPPKTSPMVEHPARRAVLLVPMNATPFGHVGLQQHKPHPSAHGETHI